MPELTLRDAMVIVGSILILAVMVDAWRRMRQQKRSRVRVKLANSLPDDAPAEDTTVYRELPNGGARVVPRDEFSGLDGEDPAESASSAGRQEASPAGGQAAAAVAPRRDPNAPSLSSGNSRAVKRDGSADGAVQGRHGSEDATQAEDDLDPDLSGTAGDDEDDSALAGVSARNDEPTNLDWLEDFPEHVGEAHDENNASLPRDVQTEVIVLHVMARSGGSFAGKDILEILLACDLRFGDMNFFHRHEQQAGRGPIQFSVANMLQPGVFDIDNMEGMQTRGLVFFLTLPGPENMLQAYDYMLETARAVARNLGGELLDESRSVLTQQAVEHARQQIRELERKLLAKS